MAKITLKAFVHPIESCASGLLYIQIDMKNLMQFVRISSADNKGQVQLIQFKDSKEMLDEANTQCHFTESLVLADEAVLRSIEKSSLDLLLSVLKEQHGYLFETSSTEIAC